MLLQVINYGCLKKKNNFFFFNILAKKNTFNFLFSSTEEMALQEPI